MYYEGHDGVNEPRGDYIMILRGHCQFHGIKADLPLHRSILISFTGIGRPSRTLRIYDIWFLDWAEIMSIQCP
jgi:hypothetical protein